MAVLILASWSQDPWLPSGHALRMGLDMNLHKALEKLGEDVGTFGGGKARTDAEERDLGELYHHCAFSVSVLSPRSSHRAFLVVVVSARIWLNCYLNDHTYVEAKVVPMILRAKLFLLRTVSAWERVDR